jgi:hypothetical protein
VPSRALAADRRLDPGRPRPVRALVDRDACLVG